MKQNYEPKSTKTMKAVDANLTVDECCEPDCKITILVEKEELAMGRKNRCMACLMKIKIRGAMNK